MRERSFITPQSRIDNVYDGVIKVTLVIKVLNIKILENTNLVANNQ